METRWSTRGGLGSSLKVLGTSRNAKQLQNPTSEYLIKNRDAWEAGLPAHVGLDAPKEIPTFIAIGGGKGGVGKSLLSANVAAKLGQAGFKVLLVDLDLGSANLHTYFGLGMPKKSLADFILYNRSPFEDILLQTSAPGVLLAAGGKDESWSDTTDFGSGAFVGLWDAMLYAKKNFGINVVILDLGAGTHRHTIDFFCSAHMGVITVLPEPTSIENAYSFLKATMWRIIENAGMHCNSCAAADEVKSILFNPQKSGKNGSHVRKLKLLHKQYPELVDHIFYALKGRQIGFVVNQIRSQRDIDIGNSMESVSRNYFGFLTRSLGYMNYDDAAWKSLRNRRLLVLDFPHCILTKRMSEVAANMLGSLGY